MKYFFLFFLSSLAYATSNTYFTTVFYDDGGVVYVGLMREDGDKREAQVITFPFAGGERVRIPLPEEIQNRNVIGLIPEKKKLFVLTHKTETEKDGPMLHVFDADKGTWKKLGQLACPSFTKVKLSPTRMVFYCETNRPVRRRRHRRESSVVAKVISFGRERLYRNGTWRFPEFMLRYKGTSLLLEGDAPTWTHLRIKPNEGEERLFQADELFQLPPPLPSPAPNLPQLPASAPPAQTTEASHG
jgi:hypothetical protein